MNVNEYQKLASRTLLTEPDTDYTGKELMLIWNALALAGEAGEVAEFIKKSIFHQHKLSEELLIKELGDVLWYIAALCTELEISMSEVMQRNINKLLKRYPDGYSPEASISRIDV